jgi:tRNA(Arg) A34 adenosine deaminase TadA
MNTPTETDLILLRRAIELAALARAHGNHPFGALLADPEGHILAEAENTVMTEHDVTGHAELNLVRIASRTLPSDVLASATLYTSTEPCAMCAGGIYWSGVSRVVFGLSEAGLAALTGADPENPTLDLPARTVLSAGQRPIEVLGPLLIEEATAVHVGFWNPRRTDQ